MSEIKSGKSVFQLLKNTWLLTISNFSSKILVFLLVPLYTSVLTTEEYGAFDLVQTTVLLMLPVLSINIYDAVMRYIMDNDYDNRIVVSVGVKYVVVSIIIFSVISIINVRLSIIKNIIPYTGYMVAYYVAYLLNQFMIQYAKGMENVKSIAISGVCNTIITLSLNLIFLLFLKIGVQGFFMAYIAGQFVSSLILFFDTKIYKTIDIRTDKNVEREMVGFSAPLVLGTIGWWCNNASDRYVITFLCGIAVNGVYSVAYKIPSILTTVQQIFIQAWQISAVKEYENNDSDKFYGNILNATNLIMCLVCMALIIMTKPIASILYQKDFYQAWQYVPFLLVAGVFNSASGVLGPVLNANKNSKSLGFSSLIGTSANIVLNFLFVLAIGPQGATIATAISSYIIFLLRKLALKEQVEFYNYWKMLFSWIIITLQAIIEIYSSKWFIEIALIIVFIAVNSDEIKNLLSKGSWMLKYRSKVYN